MAEIAHPDRLKPKVRETVRNAFLTEFNFRLSEDEIDGILFTERNRNQLGAARFMRDARANTNEGPVQ